MTSISISATGRAPASRVWERYAKPALWSSWSPQIARVECADEVIRSVPGRGAHERGISVPFDVTAVDYDAMTWSSEASTCLPLGVRPAAAAPGEGHGRRHLDRTSTLSGCLPIVIGYLPPAKLALARLVR